jgi:hypothetical protein
MNGRIEESMTSNLIVNLRDTKNKITILSDTASNAALEIAGNTKEIIFND